ncbi:MAG: phosphate signaling complex protein PhoU [Bacillota bacterium]|nr:MAG: phosphate transport system regulatory protein PhoU [Bacillota bacterium]
MAVTTRRGFQEQLADLQHEILRMGTLVEETIDRAVRSLRDLDADLARQVMAEDDRIDQLMLEIERQCLELIALQQPLAGDLRVIGTALKIITDLERMADHAHNIARTTLRLQGEQLVKPLVDIPRMAELVMAMTRDALQAYVKRDTGLAAALDERDNEVDNLYRRVFDELEELMKKDPGTIRQGLQLLLVARDLERVADHVTNLGEWVIYMVTGERRVMND